MRDGIHPSYGFVVFKDASSDFTVLTRSTKKSDKKITMPDGKEYPVIDVEISSASHPFFTGKEKLLDTAGRVERFNRKYGRQITEKK
ncbi:MAG: type B 50S ribosomal protein L31 [Proteobacteria bacterium]|jgi:large subunit ribosomal protein L31|nr:type B 50S ribosomal protein L31 [Pseudomonadota bacterium]